MTRRLFLLGWTALLPATLLADHQDFITVNANASKGYAQRKMVNGSPKRETYVFYHGKFFGETQDPTLRQVTSLDIVRILAPDLAKQNYFPTRDIKAADLLIVVNWGSTLTDESQDPTDTERQFELRDAMTAIKDYDTAFAAGSGTPSNSGLTTRRWTAAGCPTPTRSISI
jgi:hypothetical protein